jgi:hypothetical protein
MKHALSISALGAALLVAGFATTTDAEAASRRIVRPNAAGGTSATAAVVRQGPYGGGIVRGRAVATDGQGNATAVRGGTAHGPNGGTASRAGTNTRSADGSATHQSGMSASGSQGSVQSNGSASRDASGNVTQSRSTSATSSVTGNSVQSSSSYNQDTG